MDISQRSHLYLYLAATSRRHGNSPAKGKGYPCYFDEDDLILLLIPTTFHQNYSDAREVSNGSPGDATLDKHSFVGYKSAPMNTIQTANIDE